MEKHTHTVVLYLREYLLANNLFDNQRYCDNDSRFDATESLCDDSWAWDASKVEDVATCDKLKQELKRHTIHVGHGENADD